MVALAAHILDSKAAKFDPRKFKDEYETALRKLVRRKAKGHAIEPPKEREKPDNVIDLMDALRRSVGGTKRARAPRARQRGRRRKSA
jgi:non-homologous end joining protein Ku